MTLPPDTTVPPRYSEFELPRWSCLPSHVASADFERLRPATGSVPDRLASEALPDQLAFRFGADLFNAGFFWEAHEVWELVWRALPPNSRERLACQALIQAANACLKLRFGRTKAFGRLSAEVARLADEACRLNGDVAGIDMRIWNGAFKRFASRAAANGSIGYGFTPAEIEGFPFVVL